LLHHAILVAAVGVGRGADSTRGALGALPERAEDALVGIRIQHGGGGIEGLFLVGRLLLRQAAQARQLLVQGCASRTEGHQSSLQCCGSFGSPPRYTARWPAAFRYGFPFSNFCCGWMAGASLPTPITRPVTVSMTCLPTMGAPIASYPSTLSCRK